VDEYVDGVESHPVSPALEPGPARRAADLLQLDRIVAPAEALEQVARELRRHQTHASHPRYFGLFVPAPVYAAVAADALAAAFNPQLANWTHAPFAVEAERRLVRELGGRLGYAAGEVEGTFTSGGAEANATALLAALAAAAPGFAEDGVRAFPGLPTVYLSAEAHHSWHKAARAAGLGTGAVRTVPVTSGLALDPVALESMLAGDRAVGRCPLLLVGTAGTTSSGTIDPLGRLAAIAAREGLWFHVDAAWGGAAALSPALRPALGGIERADSITLDAHKWLSVPMGAGVYLSCRAGVLRRAFDVSTGYMPVVGEDGRAPDPYRHSLQWSRRFIGLKVLLAVMTVGWEGYAELIGRQAALADELRRRLEAAGWRIVNATPLPVVCFVDDRVRGGGSASHLDGIVGRVQASGEAWISRTVLGDGTPALRACISNFRTREEDLDRLIVVLERARSVSG
jgi:glutamate/tyrosine decarboxylase-like PLP-dependent enzyme